MLKFRQKQVKQGVFDPAALAFFYSVKKNPAAPRTRVLPIFHPLDTPRIWGSSGLNLNDMPARLSKLEKELRGTDRSDRPTGELQAAPLSELPPPPRGLDSAGVEVWDSVGYDLIQAERLTYAGLKQLERYCELHDVIQAARDEITRYGHFVEYPNGVRAANPALKVINEATRALQTFERLYGLNPLAASVLPPIPVRLYDDEFGIL